MGYAGLKLSDLPGGIIIAGGGAKLRGFTDLLAQHSKLKVRMGSVQGGVRISDGAVHPADNLDVISLLVAASRLPQEQCVEFPAEEAPEAVTATITTTADDVTIIAATDATTTTTTTDITTIAVTNPSRRTRLRV